MGSDITRLAASLLITALVGACGSTTAAATPAGSGIKGAATCPSSEKQALTFKGKISGHVSCSTQAVTCQKGIANNRVSSGIAVPINASVGDQPVQIIVVFWTDNGPGTYVAGPPGEGGTSNQGVTLDGIGHWISQTGGSIVIAVDDAMSASGTLDVRLTQGAEFIEITGVWRCAKPPGFCPTPANVANPCFGDASRELQRDVPVLAGRPLHRLPEA